MTQTTTGAPTTPVGLAGRIALGAYLVALSILLAYLVYGVWPRTVTTAPGQSPVSAISLFGYGFTVPLDVGFILLVMAVGALGGNVHGLKSFADFTGNRQLTSSWVWWYLVRPFIGYPLALIFFFVVRGGFVSAGVQGGEINSYGIAAVSGLVGMFSDQAISFLRRAFTNIFNPGEDQRRDRLGGTERPVGGGSGP